MLEVILTRYDSDYYLGLYVPGCLEDPPWGEEPFDCLVVNRCADLSDALVERIAEDAAAANTDWVETFGPHCERIHDAVDHASVRIGRQKAVGDGEPMTAWYDDMISIAAITEHVGMGGLGYQSVKCVLVVGSKVDAEELRSSLQTLKDEEE